ncbi:MAG: DUF4912 domain-containing protein [Acidobacteriota bacterium]
MFVLRPSSPFKTSPILKPAISEPPLSTALPVPDAQAQPSVDAEPYIDLGLPIPETYGTDIIRAMIQDPFRVFIYWEVREAHLEALTRLFAPAEVATFKTVLKLRDMNGGQEAFFNVKNRGRYWMMVFPDRAYQFEIGVHSPIHGYISLIASNTVQTPRGTISPLTADEAEYRLEPVEFIEVLEKSGFGAEQSLDITVAAMPGIEVSEDAMAETLDKLSDDIREAILFVLAGGKLTADMISAFPENIRDLLMQLMRESGSDIASVGLMHFLPELLREAIEDEREWVTDHTHPVHLAPRFFVGASDMMQLPVSELHFPKLPLRRISSDAKYQKPELSYGSTLRQLLKDL